MEAQMLRFNPVTIRNCMVPLLSDSLSLFLPVPKEVWTDRLPPYLLLSHQAKREIGMFAVVPSVFRPRLLPNDVADEKIPQEQQRHSPLFTGGLDESRAINNNCAIEWPRDR